MTTNDYKKASPWSLERNQTNYIHASGNQSNQQQTTSMFLAMAMTKTKLIFDEPLDFVNLVTMRSRLPTMHKEIWESCNAVNFVEEFHGVVAPSKKDEHRQNLG